MESQIPGARFVPYHATRPQYDFPELILNSRSTKPVVPGLVDSSWHLKTLNVALI
jgi:hypothetical protein